MARLVAVLHLLTQLVRRDLRTLTSLGLNNLSLCALFLLQSSTSARTAFYATLPFQLILLVPLLFSLATDTFSRIPSVRSALLPLTPLQHLLLSLAAIALNPALWLVGGGITLWAGFTPGLFFLLLAIAAQLVVFLIGIALRRAPSLRPVRLLPRFPGPLGGIVQIHLRALSRTLDVYTAILLALAGAAYRLLAPSPQPEAFPILAILVAVALSTTTQCALSLESPAAMTRYRLLPLAPWKLLAAKDLASLLLLTLLVAPLSLRAGLTFGLVAIAVGRYPSLRLPAPQTPWRFTRGDLRFSAAQILLGGLLALAAVRISPWILAAASLPYAASLFVARRWWNAEPFAPLAPGVPSSHAPS